MSCPPGESIAYVTHGWPPSSDRHRRAPERTGVRERRRPLLDRRRAAGERRGPGGVPDAVAPAHTTCFAAVRVDRDVGAVRVLGRRADEPVDRVGAYGTLMPAGLSIGWAAAPRVHTPSALTLAIPTAAASFGSSPPVVMNGAPIGLGIGMAPSSSTAGKMKYGDVRHAVLVERHRVAETSVVQVIGDVGNELFAFAEVDLRLRRVATGARDQGCRAREDRAGAWTRRRES
jgi:hypothetical protein